MHGTLQCQTLRLPATSIPYQVGSQTRGKWLLWRMPEATNVHQVCLQIGVMYVCDGGRLAGSLQLL